jgi:hypothetical protein
MRRLVLVCAVLILVASSAFAEPYYSVLFGQSCFLCHQNPSGRGLRSTYGSQFFAPRYASYFTISDSILARYSPQLSPSVLIGADFRSIYMAEDAPVKGQRSGFSAPFGSNTGSDNEMNATIYLALQPTEFLTLRYTQDLVGTYYGYRRFEAYGVAHTSLLHSYVKVGQFQENYGWAFSDHTTYVRTGLWEGYTGGVSGANPPIPPLYGVGSEIGISKWRINVTGSYTEAADQPYEPGPTDTQKRWVARAMIQEGIEKLGLEFTGGGSWWYMPGFGTDSSRQRWWGGFGGIGWQGIPNTMNCSRGFGFLSSALLFEYDRKAWHPTYAPTSVTGAYSTTQLSIMAQPGIWLVGTYDWLDNTGRKDGNEATRYSYGLQVFPWPWVDLMPMYRLYKPQTTSGDRSSVRHIEVQAHFLF